MDAPAETPSVPESPPPALPVFPPGETSGEESLRESLGAADAGPASFSSFTWGGYFQAVGVLILVLAGLWLALRLVRRFGKGRFLPAVSSLPRQALRMEAQLPLGQHKRIVVVRFLNKRLALGVTDQHITLLTEAEVHDDEAYSKKFHEVMEEISDRDDRAPSRQPVDGPPAGPPAAEPGPSR